MSDGKYASDPTAIEHLAAQQLLQRGVRMSMRTPRLLRWIGISKISLVVRSPYLGTMLEVSKLYLGTGIQVEKLMDITYEQALSLMSAHGVAISRAVAAAWLNGRLAIKLWTKPLAWYMRWHCSAQEIITIATMILLYGGTSDFITITRSVNQMKITSPTLGQKKNQGS